MKEESKNDKSKKHKHKKKKHKRRSSSCSSSSSEKWVEKSSSINTTQEREDWMSMTGMIKTYSKEDEKVKREEKSDKNRLDSYNPATSVRELNPYWKNGGMGLPETSENLKKKYLVPDDDDDDNYYSKPSTSKSYESSKTLHTKSTSSRYEKSNNYEYSRSGDMSRSYNWKKYADNDSLIKKVVDVTKQQSIPTHSKITTEIYREKNKSTPELYIVVLNVYLATIHRKLSAEIIMTGQGCRGVGSLFGKVSLIMIMLLSSFICL